MNSLNLNLSQYRVITLCSLLLLALLSLSTAQAATCFDYQTQVKQALRSQNLYQLGKLLRTLKRLPDCSEDYLDWLKRRMSEMAAAKAKSWVQRGQLNQAEKWLKYKYAPINSWQTQSVRGDIAAKRKQWNEAAVFYRQALDLIADTKTTPQEPPLAEINRLYQLATETQLLAGTLINLRCSWYSRGAMRENIRGFEIKKRRLPVPFVFEKALLTKEGQDTANKLIKYLHQAQPHHIILAVHTDHVGNDADNCVLSTKRALALKNYLVVTGGLNAERITTIGLGKREPLELYDPSLYTPDEIAQINQRIEFAINREVSYENACL